MVNVPLFLASLRPLLSTVPVGVYFQENQLTYPPPPGENLLWQNGFVNVASAYVADWIGFNGEYLKTDFLEALKQFVAARQDYPADLLTRIPPRCQVLNRGIALSERFGPPPARPAPNGPITFLWSHRWAFEKGIEDFAAALRQLHAENIPFQVILAGDTWDHPDLKAALLAELGDKVLQHGLLQGAEYTQALRRADVIVACSQNEPLGVSLLEGLYMGCWPILPALGSFPTLLPLEHHDLFYDGSRAALIQRLREVALHPHRAYRPALQTLASAYDWPNLVQIYDQTFENLKRP
jgi:glycosyltransferase involved in cell wall biosynthesis